MPSPSLHHPSPSPSLLPHHHHHTTQGDSPLATPKGFVSAPVGVGDGGQEGLSDMGESDDEREGGVGRGGAGRGEEQSADVLTFDSRVTGFRDVWEEGGRGAEARKLCLPGFRSRSRLLACCVRGLGVEARLVPHSLPSPTYPPMPLPPRQGNTSKPAAELDSAPGAEGDSEQQDTGGDVEADSSYVLLMPATGKSASKPPSRTSSKRSSRTSSAGDIWVSSQCGKLERRATEFHAPTLQRRTRADALR